MLRGYERTYRACQNSIWVKNCGSAPSPPEQRLFIYNPAQVSVLLAFCASGMKSQLFKKNITNETSVVEISLRPVRWRVS